MLTQIFLSFILALVIVAAVLCLTAAILLFYKIILDLWKEIREKRNQ